MNEFLNQFTFSIKDITLYIEITAAIIGSIYFYKYKNSYLRYFLIFLWYVVVNELIGKYIADVLTHDNLIYYNVYLFINFLFLFSVYWHFLNRKKYKKIVIYFSLTYAIFFILNGIFIENYYSNLVSIPFIIGSCFLIITIIFYFVEILNSERVLFMTRYLLFWISVGVLLFNIGIIPWLIFRKYFFETYEANFEWMNILSLSLSLILNISYIIGFICSYKVEKQQP
ncbi:hypothetical protein IMCC3317_06120 [Kordia antarctica]|uniref:Uncharacterized protein n=1 Tax=Kordia antarctica TaxID=1218801 RepID=A0A7L4ZG96_9FLAO|nr:hypothetical protein IMCC3317_06120 [Kordia antarctica]